MWGRLARTSRFLAVTTFGTADDAQQAVDAVRAIHERVTGDDGRRDAVRRLRPAPAGVGARRRGRQLPAGAPGLRPASRSTRPAATSTSRRPPRSPAGSACSTRPRPRPSWPRCSRRTAPSCAATPQAREAIHYLLLKPPLPLAARAPYAVLVAAAVGLMPRWTRRPLRLPWLPGLRAHGRPRARLAGHRDDPLGDGAGPRRASARSRKPGDAGAAGLLASRSPTRRPRPRRPRHVRPRRARRRAGPPRVLPRAAGADAGADRRDGLVRRRRTG